MQEEDELLKDDILSTLVKFLSNGNNECNENQRSSLLQFDSKSENNGNQSKVTY